jgi:hypothetical protein
MFADWSENNDVMSGYLAKNLFMLNFILCSWSNGWHKTFKLTLKCNRFRYSRITYISLTGEEELFFMVYSVIVGWNEENEERN